MGMYLFLPIQNSAPVCYNPSNTHTPICKTVKGKHMTNEEIHHFMLSAVDIEEAKRKIQHLRRMADESDAFIILYERLLNDSQDVDQQVLYLRNIKKHKREMQLYEKALSDEKSSYMQRWQDEIAAFEAMTQAMGNEFVSNWIYSANLQIFDRKSNETINIEAINRYCREIRGLCDIRIKEIRRDMTEMDSL